MQPIMSQRQGLGDTAVASGGIVAGSPRHRRDRRGGEPSQGPVASGGAGGTQASCTPTHPNQALHLTASSLRSSVAPAFGSR